MIDNEVLNFGLGTNNTYLELLRLKDKFDKVGVKI